MERDERWVVVDGRRWRATDPGIPEALRSELVAELMDARRTVGTAGRAGDDDAVAAARRRVQDAKVALGERGEPWWEPPSQDGRRRRLAAAVRALLRHRRPEATICPSDAARVAAGEGWRGAMDAARATGAELAAADEVEVRAKGEAVDPADPPPGPLRFARGPRFS